MKMKKKAYWDKFLSCFAFRFLFLISKINILFSFMTNLFSVGNNDDFVFTILVRV